MKSLMINKMANILIGTSLLLATATYADIAVVVHPDNPLTSITKNEGKRIFLGVTKKLPNGKTIKIVDQSNNADLKEDFYRVLTNKSSAQINSRWAGLVFSGQAIPPVQVSNDKEVKAWLKDNASGIGYIDNSQTDDSVKVVLTLKN